MDFNLIKEFTKRDFTERFSGSVLGLLWSFIWPLVNICIYIIIFSKIMGAKLPGMSSTYSYSIYLVSGLVPWIAFSNTVSRASTVFVDKKYIITKVRISLPSLPLYIVMSESITFLITLIIFIVFLIFSGNQLNTTIVLLPFVYLLQQIFAYSLGFFCAILNVFIRDIKEMIGVIIQLWFWFTPIVYVIDILPELVKDYFVFNPACLFIGAYHDIFVFGHAPNFNHLIILTLLSHMILAFAYVMYKKLEKDIRDFV